MELGIALAALLLASRSAAQVTVVNMIPQSVSAETNQDSEPNLAVNPANPLRIAGSAFTRNPSGSKTSAPIFASIDGGQTWLLNNILPSGNGKTGDITLRFADTSSTLYAGILLGGDGLHLNLLRTPDFLGSALMTLLVDRKGGQGVDQPYVEAATAASQDRVYVGDNDLNVSKSATIDRSLDAAAAPSPAGFDHFVIESRTTNGQDQPPIRPAVHPDGTVYAIYYGRRTGNLSDVVVVRDDNWGRGNTPFTALKGTDGLAGKRVVTGLTVPFENYSHPAFGQERLVASNLSIAVDPRNSSVLYIAWADRPPGASYNLHVRSSSDRGVTWSAADLLTINNATNPALALNSYGQVGFLYQHVTGNGVTQQWVTHLQRSPDGTTWDDLVLANVPASTPTVQAIPYLGDYVHLMAIRSDFYGIFSANNTPDSANFPKGVTYQRYADMGAHKLYKDAAHTMEVPVSIDPFFFKVSPPGTFLGRWIGDSAQSSNWSDPDNWWSGQIPTRGNRVVFLKPQLGVTTVNVDGAFDLSSLLFDSSAPAYRLSIDGGFRRSISLDGAGIIDNSSARKTFRVGFGNSVSFYNSASAADAYIIINSGFPSPNSSSARFFNTSTAGKATLTTNGASVSPPVPVEPVPGGLTTFNNDSTAGSATLITNGAGAVPRAKPGETQFRNNASAGNATIITNGGAVTTAPNGITTFFDSSTAGNATVSANGASGPGISFGGLTAFVDNASAGNASVVANGSTGGQAGGSTTFSGNATADGAILATNGSNINGAAGGLTTFTQNANGGTARVITNVGGTFDISQIAGPTLAVGSIEGGGSYNLGAKELSVGGNELDTMVSGVISDGGINPGTGGSLSVTGGILTLSGTNTYSGQTLVDGGTLVIAAGGSLGNTGITVLTGAGFTVSGAVNNSAEPVVISGFLNGTGTIAGALMVEDGGTIQPGPGTGIGTLTTNQLTLSDGSELAFTFSSNANSSINVTGQNGLTINSGTVAVNVYEEGTSNPPTSMGSHAVINYSGTLNGSIDNLEVGNGAVGFVYSFYNDVANHSIKLIIGPIPP